MSAGSAPAVLPGLVAVALWDREDRLASIDDAFFDLFPEQRSVVMRGRRRQEMPEATMFLPQTEPRRAVTAGGRVLHVAETAVAAGGRVSVFLDSGAWQTDPDRRESADSLLRDGLESMADGVTIWDAEDRLVIWNAPYERMHEGLRGKLRVGLRFEEAVAMLTPEVFKDWDPAQCARWTAERIALHRNCVSPREYIQPDGSTIEIRERRTSEGGIVAVFRDVTAAREAMRALARSEAQASRLALVAAHARSAIAILDGARRIEWVNPAFVTLTGWTQAEALGEHPIDPFAADPRDVAVGRLREALRAAAPAQVDILERRRDGSTYWSAVELVPAPGDGDAAPERLIMLRADVTLRRREAEQLERALAAEREMNAQQRRFVSIASHEFRTPLAVIDGATQRLTARLSGGDPDIDKRLDRIRGAVSRMSELIDRTLSSARLDEGRIEMAPQSLDVGVLLREVIERQAQISRQFVIRLDAPDEECLIDGDPKLLEQVFANLLSNAVKYSGRSREIAVRLETDPAWVRIAVSDHGVGIPADELSNLFTRFFRASTATGIPGTGIGLNLVREFVAMHGGSVDVHSEVGGGSTFTVTLPRRPRTPAAAE